ncbi:MAG: serine acetyltransferase [Proteobacteria bacterium]|nr:serine acetyltransferase [Pseudomonadota bacterium]
MNQPATLLRALDTAGGHATWDLQRIVDGLRKERERWRLAHQRKTAEREFPSPDALREIASNLCGSLFPMRLGPPDLRSESEDYYVGHTLDRALNGLLQQVRLELAFGAREEEISSGEIAQQAATIVGNFAHALPEIRALLDTDVEAAYRGDPAARSVDEVLLCYPGILAIIHYRLAHHLYRDGAPLVARMLSEIAHSATGIDIHPGARIGASFFIDHGTGVVIGETSVIGERVRVYQAVTLGAKSFPVNENGELQKDLPRHPVVEDDVVIYAGATILGRITIGRGSTVGGNVWLTRSIPSDTHVTQANTQNQLVSEGLGI